MMILTTGIGCRVVPNQDDNSIYKKYQKHYWVIQLVAMKNQAVGDIHLLNKMQSDKLLSNQ